MPVSIAGNFSQPVTTLSTSYGREVLGGNRGVFCSLLFGPFFVAQRSSMKYQKKRSVDYYQNFTEQRKSFFFVKKAAVRAFTAYHNGHESQWLLARRPVSGTPTICPNDSESPKRERFRSRDASTRVASENYSAAVTLVHSVAQKLGRSQAGIHLCHSPPRKLFQGEKEFEASWTERDRFKRQIKHCESWNCLFRDFLCAGIDLHHIADGKAPLVAFLQGYFYHDKRPKNELSACVMALRSWLTGLKAAGVTYIDIGGRR